MEAIGIGTLIAMVVTGVNIAKYVTNGQWRSFVTQVFALIVGVAVTMLAAQTDFADRFNFGDLSLAGLNAWSQAFLGLMMASGASVIVEALKAIDNSRSSDKPPLIP